MVLALCASSVRADPPHFGTMFPSFLPSPEGTLGICV